MVLLFFGNNVVSQKASLDTISKKTIRFDGLDGPYLINDTIYRVTQKNVLIREKANVDSLLVKVDNISKDEFYVKIRSEYKVSPSVYPEPQKIITISDIEGKYNAFASFLISNHVMDTNHNWIFGSGHLVLLGDFVDRGKNVTQVLWLIYKLEHQAILEGGQVHFILGNHEVLNFHGDHRYNRGKYIKVAQEISGNEDKVKAIQLMYSKNSELGKWLATKNVIEKIGTNIFVHAGLSIDILKYGLSLEKTNDKVRSGYFKKEVKEDDVLKFLYGSKGPFWYRGLVMNRPSYRKAKALELSEILGFYGSKKIIVGHTVVDDICTGYEGKVIMIDVPHGNSKFSGKTKGLLIENGLHYKVDDIDLKSAL